MDIHVTVLDCGLGLKLGLERRLGRAQQFTGLVRINREATTSRSNVIGYLSKKME